MPTFLPPQWCEIYRETQKATPNNYNYCGKQGSLTINSRIAEVYYFNRIQNNIAQHKNAREGKLP